MTDTKHEEANHLIEFSNVTLEIVEGIELLTEEVRQGILNNNTTIFFNDVAAYYWFMAFKIGDTWNEPYGRNEAMQHMKIILFK